MTDLNKLRQYVEQGECFAQQHNILAELECSSEDFGKGFAAVLYALDVVVNDKRDVTNEELNEWSMTLGINSQNCKGFLEAIELILSLLHMEAVE